MIRIRPETGDDKDAIRQVNCAAFPTFQEADLVEALRENRDSEISLLADEDGEVVGHVMLSRMRVEGDGRPWRALGLAPVAVQPGRQRQGIGSALIRDALRLAEESGEELVFLVGDPAYYRRFGFSCEAAAVFDSPYAGEYFMAKSFVPLPRAGRAEYSPAFGNLS